MASSCLAIRDSLLTSLFTISFISLEFAHRGRHAIYESTSKGKRNLLNADKSLIEAF